MSEININKNVPATMVGENPLIFVVNVEKVRKILRKIADDYAVSAEDIAKVENEKNYFKRKYGAIRQQESNSVAQQAMEIADGMRGVLANIIKRARRHFADGGKVYNVSLGRYGCKRGGTIGHCGSTHYVGFSFNRRWEAESRSLDGKGNVIHYHYGD